MNQDPTETLIAALRAEVAALQEGQRLAAAGAEAGAPAGQRHPAPAVLSLAGLEAGDLTAEGAEALQLDNELLRAEVEQLKQDAAKEQERLHKMKEYIQRQHQRLKDEVSPSRPSTTR